MTWRTPVFGVVDLVLSFNSDPDVIVDVDDDVGPSISSPWPVVIPAAAMCVTEPERTELATIRTGFAALVDVVDK